MGNLCLIKRRTISPKLVEFCRIDNETTGRTMWTLRHYDHGLGSLAIPGAIKSGYFAARFPVSNRHSSFSASSRDALSRCGYLEKADAAERKSPGWMFGKKGRYSLLTHMGLGLGK